METVKEFFYKNKKQIAEDITKAPKVLFEGVKLLAGMSEIDMPFLKEIGQAKLLGKMGYDVVLLPRFANNFIKKTYNKDVIYGSFPDGLLMLLDQKKFVEFKRVTRPNITRRLNSAKDSDVIFMSVSNGVTQSKLKDCIKLSINHNFLSDETHIIVLSETDGRMYEKKQDSIPQSPDMRVPDVGISADSLNRLTEQKALPLSYVKYITDKYFVNENEILSYENYLKNSKHLVNNICNDVKNNELANCRGESVIMENTEKNEQQEYKNFVLVLPKNKVAAVHRGKNQFDLYVSMFTPDKFYASEEMIKKSPELKDIAGKHIPVTVHISNNNELVEGFLNDEKGGGFKGGDRIEFVGAKYSAFVDKNGVARGLLQTTSATSFKNVVHDDLFFTEQAFTAEELSKNKEVTAVLRVPHLNVKLSNDKEGNKIATYYGESTVQNSKGELQKVAIIANGKDDAKLVENLNAFTESKTARMGITGVLGMWTNPSTGKEIPCIDISGGKSGPRETFAIIESANDITKSMNKAKDIALTAGKEKAVDKAAEIDDVPFGDGDDLQEDAEIKKETKQKKTSKKKEEPSMGM